jgi:hypothetical protein
MQTPFRGRASLASIPFALFYERCPEIAAEEICTLSIAEELESGVPAGTYALLEMYCDEEDCDCRRVLLSVRHLETREIEAVISFGWEERSFYVDWMGEDDPPFIDAMMGPCLHLGPAQGPHADVLLELVAEPLLGDPDFVARLARHYELFRKDVEQNGDGEGQ